MYALILGIISIGTASLFVAEKIKKSNPKILSKNDKDNKLKTRSELLVFSLKKR